jgi:energy-coupling factor transporter ATP-binding protein EcfA2
VSAPVLEFEHVSYRYPGASGDALAGVDLTISAGELVVVAGGSGSGKSTLLRVASGLVPHFYGGEFAGRASVGGMDTRQHRPGDLAAAVGTVLQDPESQVVMSTPRAELAFGLENRGASSAALARGVEEAALALGIAHLLDRPTSELSGGELQRVALAGALAPGPVLLVLDEPTSQLDPVAAEELLSALRRLNEDLDMAVVLAEHRLERCLGWADRVLAMRDGAVVCDRTPQQFLEWALGANPELTTPAARLLDGVGLRPAAGVKAGRWALREAGFALDGRRADAARVDAPALRRPAAALELRNVWHEVRNGPAILRGVSLTVRAGERVALMGRNGAGKSTLLRHAAGLMKPTRGSVTAAGRVALLLQNPTDYLVHETVAEEATEVALTAAGLDPAAIADRHPRDLSGGEKQRLALAVVIGPTESGDKRSAALALDEPTRGMDRLCKEQLASLLRDFDGAVLVATHDPEFVAAWAQRVVLLADGAPIADGPVREVLAGGTFWATEVARILGGAGSALSAEEGLALLTAPQPVELMA